MKTDSTTTEATTELREILEELYFTLEEAEAAIAPELIDHARSRYVAAMRCVREVERRYDLDTGKVEEVRRGE